DVGDRAGGAGQRDLRPGGGGAPVHRRHRKPGPDRGLRPALRLPVLTGLSFPRDGSRSFPGSAYWGFAYWGWATPAASSMPRRASASARSLPGSPACPFTHTQSTSCGRIASVSRRHRSSFLPGFLAAVFQPLRCQFGIHLVIPSSRYLLSVCRLTVVGRCSASSAWMAAISSIRLFVVSGSKPYSSFSLPCQRITTPQPPGPGFPLQAPSV